MHCLVQNREGLGAEERRCEEFVLAREFALRARKAKHGAGTDDEPGHCVPPIGFGWSSRSPGRPDGSMTWPRTSRECTHYQLGYSGLNGAGFVTAFPTGHSCALAP